MDYETETPPIVKYPRPIGAAFLGGSAVLAYLCIAIPVNDARAGSESISLSMSGVFMTFFCFIVGFVFLVFGARFAPYFVAQEGRSKAKLYATVAVICAVSFGAYLWLQQYLESLGYTFQ